jgi:hypothetical protein
MAGFAIRSRSGATCKSSAEWGRSEAWKSERAAPWTITALTLVAAALFIFTAAASKSVFGPGVYAGLFGRFMMLGYAAGLSSPGYMR